MGWFKLGKLYPPDWTGRPPQLPAEDWPTWLRYLAVHKSEYEGFFYNVHLTLKNPPEDMDEASLKAWAAAWTKRIDAVGMRSRGVFDIIEITGYAGLRALGQVLTYQSIWNKLRISQNPPLAIIVAERVDHDIEPIAHAQGVVLSVV